MAALDFRRCTDLFLGSERELAMALAISTGELTRLRANPAEADDARMLKLARVLKERGRGMIRVAEMLHEELGDPGAQGNGGPAA